MTAAPAKNPCGSCPYRQDVPSGVWVEAEYEKLPAYDNDTAEQPIAPFFCHQQDGRLCAGWVGCHDMDNNLGLRMGGALGHLTAADCEAARKYVSPVPLWPSGQAAYDHGIKDVADPSDKAIKVINRVGTKIKRRQHGK